MSKLNPFKKEGKRIVRKELSKCKSIDFGVFFMPSDRKLAVGNPAHIQRTKEPLIANDSR